MTSETASKTTPVGSPRNSSSLDEDLPLYGEFQYSDQNDALPPATATPVEVADFLPHLVVSTESMSLDQTRGVATKWTKGAGQDLLSYPDAIYFQIFGYENGWIVCREVKIVAHRENMKTFAGKFGICESYHLFHWCQFVKPERLHQSRRYYRVGRVAIRRLRENLADV
jgi:hypothetical protein